MCEFDSEPVTCPETLETDFELDKYCAIGSICVRGQCVKARKLSETCDDENRCDFGMGCANGVCVNLFSLEDWTSVSSGDASLCYSG